MFIRDKETGVIVNTDDSYYKAILAEREKEEIKKNFRELEADLFQIKKLLADVINGKTDS